MSYDNTYSKAYYAANRERLLAAKEAQRRARGVPVRRRTPVADHFWGKVAKSDGCWKWTASRDRHGYGHVMVDRGRSRLAHRVAYELVVGPIPTGTVLDHLCRNPPCVNPAHLEPVTQTENLRRAAAFVTHCPQGHPYEDGNTYVDPSGGRRCNACRRERDRAH